MQTPSQIEAEPHSPGAHRGFTLPQKQGEGGQAAPRGAGFAFSSSCGVLDFFLAGLDGGREIGTC